MDKEYIFKCIKTKRNGYIYDRHTNSIFEVKDNEFDEFVRIQKGEINPINSKIFLKYNSQGLLQKNVVEEIKHPSTDYLEYLANNHLDYLDLQVTQQCNLRCAYCAYSGLYKNHRTHSGKRMDFETGKKAIDFFLEKTLESKELYFAFYGGEPLLELDLIKKLVEYIKHSVEGKPIGFGMTTNGTLLSEETVKYLHKENFKITISLDGGREEHNINRKFSNGEGSFDVIMKNVRELRKKYPEYGETIIFNTVVNPKANLGCVLEYFNADEIMSDSNIMFTEVDSVGIKSDLIYSENTNIIRRFEYLKLLLMLIGRVKREDVSRLMISSVGDHMRFHQKLNRHNQLHKSVHHGGPCLPGVKTLFVTTEGSLYPCEKVNDTSEYFRIGNLDEGFNYEKMRSIINNGHITKEECKNCWNLQQCQICSAQVEMDDGCTLCKENKLRVCSIEKNNMLRDLYEICVLREFGYDLIEEGELYE